LFGFPPGDNDKKATAANAAGVVHAEYLLFFQEAYSMRLMVLSLTMRKAIRPS
jgi:hypothetical protein